MTHQVALFSVQETLATYTRDRQHLNSRLGEKKQTAVQFALA